MTTDQPIMTYRPATMDDYDLLTRWSRQFEELFLTPGQQPRPVFIGTTLEFLRKHPDRGDVLVFDISNQPAGYAILIYFWSNEFRGELCVIDELFLAPEHRGGNGGPCIRLLEAHARARGCHLLSLEVVDTNARAQSLYRREGFRTDRAVFFKELT